MTATAVDSFRIDLPESWQQMPTDADELRALVRDQRDSDQWQRLSRTDQRTLEMYVERFIADLRGAGAVVAALYSERVSAGAAGAAAANGDAEAPADDEGLLVASCAISIMQRDQIGSAVPLSADVVLAAMSLEPDEDAGGQYAEQTTSNLEPPAVVELRSGKAVRVVRLVEQKLSLKDPLRFFTETFFVPVPEEWESLLVAQFATPNVGDAPVFSELFGELANTIRFYREDEPTEL